MPRKSGKPLTLEQVLSFYGFSLGRDLPKLYHRKTPCLSRVKEDFSLFALLKEEIEKKASWLKEKLNNRGEGLHLGLCTWVHRDGWGDFFAAKQLVDLLDKELPKLKVTWICFLPEGKDPPLSTKAKCFLGDLSFPKELFFLLEPVNLILHMPTVCREFEEALLARFPALPQRFLGEYGFVEAKRYRPGTGNYAMGLHFLEQGIFFPEIEITEKLEHKELQNWLKIDETYFQKHQLHLAYIQSPVAGRIYLEGVIDSNHFNGKILDFCTPDIDWFIAYLKEPPLFFGSRLEIYEEGRHFVVEGSEGPHVRIFCVKGLSKRDFHYLLRKSSGLVAVRGNQSLSEALSLGKPFFYDGPEHVRFFLRDLVSLARQYLEDYPATQSFIDLMWQVHRYSLSPQEGDWVEGWFFEETIPIETLSLKLSKLIQEKELLEGFAFFSQKLKERHCIDPFVLGWISSLLKNPKT